MTMTSEPTRRVRVTHEPLPGVKPWRAVIVEGLDVHPGGERVIPVGRFAAQAEAATVGVSALRFVAAGIPWQPVGVTE